MRVLCVSLVMLATAGWAADSNNNCSIKLEKNDQLSRGKDLEVSAGETIHDAIVIDGDLLVKKGAHVHNAMVTGGTVKLEDGAVVEGDVVVFDGHAKVAKGATVKGAQVIVGKQLKIVGDSGDKASFSIDIEGKSLSAMVGAAVLKELRDCKIEN